MEVLQVKEDVMRTQFINVPQQERTATRIKAIRAFHDLRVEAKDFRRLRERFIADVGTNEVLVEAGKLWFVYNDPEGYSVRLNVKAQWVDTIIEELYGQG